MTRHADRGPSAGAVGSDAIGARVTGLVLAAGSSRRLGRPKQLLPYRGKILLQHVVDVAADSDLGEIVVVLGHLASEVRAALSLPAHARVIENPDHTSGQASSLRHGLLAASPSSEAAIVLLGDQPAVASESVRRMLEGWRAGGTPVARAEYAAVGGTGGETVPGHPVVLGRTIWDALLALGGDEGAKAAFADHPEWVTPVTLPGPMPLEVDIPDDYERLLRDS